MTTRTIDKLDSETPNERAFIDKLDPLRTAVMHAVGEEAPEMPRMKGIDTVNNALIEHPTEPTMTVKAWKEVIVATRAKYHAGELTAQEHMQFMALHSVNLSGRRDN